LGLIDELDNGPVAVDAAILIYLVQEHPKYLPMIRPLFQQASAGQRELITSALTLLEVLVVPYQKGNRALAERYHELMTRSRGFRMVDITREQLLAAAQLRAVTGIKTPDALQMSAALASGCRALITNDRRLPSVSGLRVIQLTTYA
jgi:predicted nucleic acid-binding protein